MIRAEKIIDYMDCYSTNLTAALSACFSEGEWYGEWDTRRPFLKVDFEPKRFHARDSSDVFHLISVARKLSGV